MPKYPGIIAIVGPLTPVVVTFAHSVVSISTVLFVDSSSRIPSNVHLKRKIRTNNDSDDLTIQ